MILYSEAILNELGATAFVETLQTIDGAGFARAGTAAQSCVRTTFP